MHNCVCVNEKYFVFFLETAFGLSRLEPYDEQNTRFLQMLEEETVTPNSREFCPIMNAVFQMLEEETMSTCHSEFYDSCTDEK